MEHLLKIQKILKNPLFISSQPNLRYFSGFTGTTGILVITKKRAWFFADRRYTIVVKKQLPKAITPVVVETGDTKILQRTLLVNGIAVLEFDAQRTTVSEFAALKKNLGRKIKLVPSKLSLDEARSVKTSDEIVLMRAAGRITIKIFERLKKKVRLGMTEMDLAWEIRKFAHELGAEEMAFHTIVAFGKNSASPHHQTGKTKLKRGDAIQIDLGVNYRGYMSDMSRVLFADAPQAKMRAIYEEVLQTQLRAMSKVRAGARCAKIAEEFVSKTIENAADMSSFAVAHGLGHGVGLEIHELPVLRVTSKEILKENHVVTVEPGIYVRCLGGVRIEDTVVVARRSVEILTPAPKSLSSAILKV